MKHEHYLSELGGVAYNKKIWMIATILSVIVNLGLTAGLLTQKHTVQTVFLPPEINQPFTLTNGHYSNAYVEQVTTWFISQVLNYTPASFEHQMITFSKHIDPELFGDIQKTLLKQFNEIKRQNRSSTFFIQKVRIRGLMALITGIRQIKVGSTSATEEQQHWYVKLAKRKDGLVTLAEFKEVSQSDIKPFMR